MRRPLAVALCLLMMSCANAGGEWPAETVPVIAVHPAPPVAMPRPCQAIDPAILTETKRVTPIAEARDADALTAALIGSEAAKNASLARLARAYENCRRRAAK